MEHVPVHFKRAQLTVIPKPGKYPYQLTKRLIPIISTLFEKLFHKRLRDLICEHVLVPSYQFGVRQHDTTEQDHRVAG